MLHLNLVIPAYSNRELDQTNPARILGLEGSRRRQEEEEETWMIHNIYLLRIRLRMYLFSYDFFICRYCLFGASMLAVR